MATFTALGADDVAAIAAAAELGAVVAVAPIAAGTINSNFAFTTATGRWFVRINEGKRPDDVAWEAELVVALAAAGLPTPSPRRFGSQRFLDHRGLLISVFPWVDGASLRADEVTATTAAELGAHLARLHTAAATTPGRAGIYQWPDIVARLDRIAARREPALHGAVATLVAAAADLAAVAEVRAAAPRGIIHGDLFRDNVLWRGPALVALLDFEQAATGSYAYDLAVAIHDWCWDGEVREELARALAAAYRAGRRWTAADAAALPHELVAAAARFTITRITDVYLRQVDNPDKDYRAFLARLEFWRSPAGARVSSALAGL